MAFLAPEAEAALTNIFSKSEAALMKGGSKTNFLSKINQAKQERIKTLSSLKNKELEFSLSGKNSSGNSKVDKLENLLLSSSSSSSSLKNEKGNIFGKAEGDLFKLPGESTILVRGLMIFIGFLLIVQGIFSVKTYEKRKNKDASLGVVRSYDAAAFFVGVGVGVILHQALSFFDFKFVDKVFIYILILGIAVYAGYVTNRMNVISKESDTKKAQNVALTAESFSLGMIGVAIGVVISFTFVSISKFVEGPLILYVEVAGVVVGGLFVAAACANQFYLYDNTGKNYRTALIVSIIVFILAILAIVGALVLAFV